MQVTCSQCGSILEYSKDPGEPGLRELEEVTCPICNNRVGTVFTSLTPEARVISRGTQTRNEVASMGNELSQRGPLSPDIVPADVNFKYQRKNGKTSASYKQNGIAFRGEQSQYGSYGTVRKVSQFVDKIPKGDRIEIAKKLYREGHTQQEIADMLGISQSQVSNMINS